MTGKRSTESNIQSYRIGHTVTTLAGRLGIVAALSPDSLGGVYVLFEVGTLEHFTASDKDLKLA